MQNISPSPRNTTFLSAEEDKQFLQEVYDILREEIAQERYKDLAQFPVFPPAVFPVPEKLARFLLAFERVAFYDSIAKKYTLSQKQRADLPHIVWKSAIEKKWDSLPSLLMESLSLEEKVCRAIAQQLFTDLYSFVSQQQKPSSEKSSAPEESPKIKNILSLSLKKALGRYPKIINERITDADIVFRGSDGPSVPSIKNWITAYHQEMGSGTHEPFERSQFLFHNENTAKFTARERNVLSEILRSLDEESELPINTDTQSIDLATIEAKFPEKEERRTSPTETATPKAVPSQNSQTLPQSPSFSQVAPASARPLSQNIPPAQRSEVALYAHEFVDDRKDAWHEQPNQNKKLETSPIPSRQTASPPAPAQHLQKDIPSSGNNSSKTPLSPSPTTLLEYNPRPFSAIATPSASPSAPRPIRIQPKINPKKVAPSQQASLASLFPEQKDYTDYYPIEPRTPINPIASNISFSSSHTFPTERKEEEIFMPQSQKTPPVNTPQRKTIPPQRVPQTTPQNTIQTQQPPKKRMIIG